MDLFYWERTAAHLQFRDELQALAAAHPNLRVHLLTTREGERRPRASIPMICRWPAMTRRWRSAMCWSAVRMDSLPLRVNAWRTRWLASRPSLPPAPLRDASSEGEVSLTLARSGRQLSVPRGRSLLESLEAHGIEAQAVAAWASATPAPVIASVAPPATFAPRLQSESAQPVRICVSAPITDLTLDL